MGTRVVALDERCGPGQARNRGAATARGAYLLFVDADVCLRPDAMSRVVATFVNDPAADAVFGSYDLHPAAPNFISQYKNLFHHFVHGEARREASTFWAGCGAVRRRVFLDLDGFDAHFDRPCIEDIEFGVRLKEAGGRILIDKEMQGTHLKRWKLWSLIRTDIFDRGIPWTRLILQQGKAPNDLNLTFGQRLSALLSLALLLCIGLAFVLAPAQACLVLLLVTGILLADSLTGWTNGSALGLLPALAATCTASWAVGAALGAWAWVPLGLAAGIVGLNLRFYRFFARVRGWHFAAAVFPLHVLYFLYSVAAFAAGNGLHWLDKLAADHISSPARRASEETAHFPR
jgi:cellulose synthase/poly-beta-1,6-N-acetylglucosamine synthase-like glycosyltransferase